MTAYILIQIQASQAPREVVKGIRGIEGVKSAHAVFGPADVIAQVEVPDQVALAALLDKINEVPGVARTDTRIALPF